MSGPAGEDLKDKAQTEQWRRLIPYLYDWFANHALPWPSLTCRWGSVIDETPNRRRQRLYLSEQTDGSEANKLVVVAADVCKPRVAASEHLTAWNENSRSTAISAKPLKVIIHPGEVNKVRELPGHPGVVVTHTDAPQLYVWNTESQPHRQAEKGAKDARLPSTADLVLTGHADDAEFALGLSTVEPLVASGGRDKKVLVWNLGDHASALGASAPPTAPGAKRTELAAATTLSGHSKTVEDVCFAPGSPHELASCADDASILFWDLRAGASPAAAVKPAHGRNDIHCLDWSAHAPELVVSGAADGSLRLWDRRKLTGAAPLLALSYHTAPAICVEWSPHRAGVFASGSEDRLLCIWDINRPASAGEQGPEPSESAGPAAGAKRGKGGSSATPGPGGSPVPPQLLFQHCGHRSPVVDFHWNPSDPWTIASASDEASEGGGGTLQLWRVSDMIYRPDEEVLGELEQYREFIITGQEAALKRAREGGLAREGSKAPGDAGDGDRTAANNGGTGAGDPSEPGPEGTSKSKEKGGSGGGGKAERKRSRSRQPSAAADAPKRRPSEERGSTPMDAK